MSKKCRSPANEFLLHKLEVNRKYGDVKETVI